MGTGHQVDVIVLTHRRRGPATETVSRLLDDGVDRIVLVINGDGGIDESRFSAEQLGHIEVVHLPENLGPAAGYDAGMSHLTEHPRSDWWLVVEDDLADIDPPARDLGSLIDRVRRHESVMGTTVGAVAAYARRLSPVSGVAHVDPPVQVSNGLLPADVAAWGATLVRAEVVHAGVRPDPAFFFGYEDFDWFLRVREAGFEVLLDHDYLRRLEGRQARTSETGERRHDDLDAWRLYYSTREFFRFSRRHGRVSWLLVHLLRSARRAQLSSDPLAWRAVGAGAADGWRRRTGRNDAWLRS